MAHLQIKAFVIVFFLFLFTTSKLRKTDSKGLTGCTTSSAQFTLNSDKTTTFKMICDGNQLSVDATECLWVTQYNPAISAIKQTNYYRVVDNCSSCSYSTTSTTSTTIKCTCTINSSKTNPSISSVNAFKYENGVLSCKY